MQMCGPDVVGVCVWKDTELWHILLDFPGLPRIMQNFLFLEKTRKKEKTSASLKDFRPVVITYWAMKCSEKIVKSKVLN